MQHVCDMERQISGGPLVEGIVNELLRLNRSIDQRKAGERAENLIRTLRGDIKRQRKQLRPKDTRKRILGAAKHAKALLSDLRSLPAEFREQLLGPEAEDSVRWIENLVTVSGTLEMWSELKVDGGWSAELHVAFKAIELIETESPEIDRADLKLTKGSPFYLIADYLWEAASGNEQDLKRYCDAILHAARNGKSEVSNTVIIGPLIIGPPHLQ
jgi:hypothetical protein